MQYLILPADEKLGAAKAPFRVWLRCDKFCVLVALELAANSFRVRKSFTQTRCSYRSDQVCIGNAEPPAAGYSSPWGLLGRAVSRLADDWGK